MTKVLLLGLSRWGVNPLCNLNSMPVERDNLPNVRAVKPHQRDNWYRLLN